MRSTGGVVLLILLIVGAPAWAAEGTSGAQWLAIGVGARAAALGGAYVSLADDGAALSWNPAGLARVDGHRFTVTHISWLSGAAYEYGGYAGRLGSGAGVGVVLEQGGVSWDNTGDGDFDAGDFCGAFGYARSIRENIAVGGGLKLLSSSLGEDQASSYALDAGVLYEPLDGVSVGAAVRNLGPGIDFGGGSDPLPATIAAGASYAWRDVLVALDVEKQNDLDPAARMGVEYRPMRSLALRGGAVLGSESALSAFSAGVGFSWNDRWSVDYAYRPSELTDTHHLGLSAALGGAAGAPVAAASGAGGGPSSGPPVAMAPESNITVVSALTREVIAEALERMTIPPGSSVYVAQVDKHDASWLVQSVLLEELTSLGHVVKAGGIAGEEGGAAYEVSYRVVSCETTLPRAWREWVVGARRVERKTTVDIYFQFANDSKDVLWAGNARRERREIVPGGLVKQLATPGQTFTAPELEPGGWDKILEPVVVAGIVGGLIYLFYTSKSSS
jgi:hypothetical protein